jgi:hypothetical protein
MARRSTSSGLMKTVEQRTCGLMNLMAVWEMYLSSRTRSLTPVCQQFRLSRPPGRESSRPEGGPFRPFVSGVKIPFPENRDRHVQKLGSNEHLLLRTRTPSAVSPGTQEDRALPFEEPEFIDRSQQDPAANAALLARFDEQETASSRGLAEREIVGLAPSWSSTAPIACAAISSLSAYQMAACLEVARPRLRRCFVE